MRSERGAHGGYALAREADELTVGEVVRGDGRAAGAEPVREQVGTRACPTYRCPTERLACCAASGSTCATRSPASSTGRRSRTWRSGSAAVGAGDVRDMNARGRVPDAREQAVLRRVLAAIRKVQHGYVQVIVQDGKVIQIDTMEKRGLTTSP